MSADPFLPPTVEKRSNVSVVLPTALKIWAQLYFVMSWVRGTCRIRRNPWRAPRIQKPPAIELGHLLDEMVVLHQHWAARADRERMLVILHRTAKSRDHGGFCCVVCRCYGPFPVKSTLGGNLSRGAGALSSRFEPFEGCL